MRIRRLFRGMKIRINPIASLLVASFGLGLAVAGLLFLCSCGSPVEPEPDPEPIVASVLAHWSENHPTYHRPDSMTIYADGVFLDDATGYISGPYHMGFPLPIEDFSPETVFTVYVYGVPENYPGNYWCHLTVEVGYENEVVSLIDVVENPVFTFSLPESVYE